MLPVDALDDERLGAAPMAGKLRWLLIVMSGALLALLLASGVLAVRFLSEIQARQQAVTNALLGRTELLQDLWLSTQRYNEAVREFVVHAEADRNQASRQRIEQLTVEIDSDLKRYPADRDLAEAELLDGITAVYSQQRTLYLSVITPKPARNSGETSLSHQLIPLEKQTLDWSERFRAWNQEKLQQADRAMVVGFAGAQKRLSQVLAIGFGSGLLLVMASMAYIVRLERQMHARYLQLARSRHELQLLSSRLVDAQETERRSISRELHDEIGQSLGALLVDIGRLSTTLGSDRPEAKEQLAQMKSLAERTFAAVRNIALLLRPSMLDDLGLVAALEWLAREVSRRSPIEVAIEADDIPESLPDELRVCIYRLVQEALNNAVRHSGAANAKVTLQQSSKGILVRVTDDGRGFEPKRTRGLGILGMEERVIRLGGTFTVESQPGQGASFTAVLPISPADGKSF
jgi:signal transduction histidine kinase